MARADGPYVEPTEHLVCEVVVRDIKRSIAFYRSLGFELLRDAGDFVELTWEDHRLYLARSQPSKALSPRSSDEQFEEGVPAEAVGAVQPA